jgi:hypothetical protein
MTDGTKYGDRIPDDYWDEDDEQDAESPASLESHEVDVILTTDPTEDMGYGREKYTIHIGHDFEDSPVAVFATEHRWKGNFWRDVRQIDWHDVPGAVKREVADVVDCDGVNDLHPGRRVVGEGGRSTWTSREGGLDGE